MQYETSAHDTKQHNSSDQGTSPAPPPVDLHLCAATSVTEKPPAALPEVPAQDQIFTWLGVKAPHDMYNSLQPTGSLPALNYTVARTHSELHKMVFIK